MKPWQIRREGRANIDLRRYETLALANVEREAEEICSGRRKLGNNNKFVLSLTEDAPEVKLQTEGEDFLLLGLASRIAEADTMRKEVNVAKAVLHAEEQLIPVRNQDSTFRIHGHAVSEVIEAAESASLASPVSNCSRTAAIAE